MNIKLTKSEAADVLTTYFRAHSDAFTNVRVELEEDDCKSSSSPADADPLFIPLTEFVIAARDGWASNEHSPKIQSIKNVREVARQHGLRVYLADAKNFVEAIGGFVWHYRRPTVTAK
jgi:hypothetical protein